MTVERPPYYSYMDSTSGKLEPASGARASIPGEDYWPEGTSSRVRAARAPQPAGESSSFPSYGKNPGSRRKKNRKATEENVTVETNDEVSDSEDSSEEEENDSSDGFVTYNNEFEREEEENGFELDKKLGRPHPFIDPTKKKQIEKTLTGDESWWNWRKPEKEQWSRWQRRRPDVETVSHFRFNHVCLSLMFDPLCYFFLLLQVFLKAMAETGQVKLYGEEPTLTETSLYRARRHLFKEERSLNLTNFHSKICFISIFF